MTVVAPLSPTQRLVLRLIEAAAEAGAVCPTNNAIANSVGIEPSSVCKAIRALEDGGWIRVKSFTHGREVTVIASGRATRWDGGRVPRGRAAPLAAPADVVTDLTPPSRASLLRVDRDPCFLCGTRADLGCAHRPAAVPEEVSA